jgi:uncharacterized peroxidase-related enzyme
MFLSAPPPNEANSALFSRDIAEDGYVSNFIRLWGWRPELFEAFFNLRKLLNDQSGLSLRERSILVCAAAATLGDSYCALAFGEKLALETDPLTAAAVLQGKEPAELTPREKALATWARKVVREPNATTAEDVERLRSAGLTDQEIFDVTLFIAFRLAFSTVNDALGAHPDRQLAETVPAAVRDAVVYGRSVSEELSR